jgi:hypothetical protein
MRNLFCALLLALAIFGPVPARAFETPIQDPKGITVLEKLGVFFKPVADQFACPEYAWATIANEGKLASLEFIPAGAKVEQWKRMVTITVYSLGGDVMQDKSAMFSIMDALTKQFESNGKLIRREMYKNKADEVSAFFDYETGLGAAKEHNAGVFMRVTPTLAAFMQVQSRDGSELSPEDILKIHQMVNPQAAPEAKK